MAVEQMIKKMVSDRGVCPACGCTLMIKKTFFDECFSCYSTVWKPFPKPVKEEQNEANNAMVVGIPQTQRGLA